MHLISRLNDWLANRMSEWLSQMWLFWLLCFMTWGTVVIQRPQGAQGWDLFLVSIFFQAVALPVINYTSGKQGRETTKLLQETHDTVMNELTELRAMHEAQADELAELKEMHRELLQRHDRLQERYDRLVNFVQALVGGPKCAK